jgi:hypothetical protein
MPLGRLPNIWQVEREIIMTMLSVIEGNVRRRLRPEVAATQDSSLYGGLDDQVQGKVRDDIRDRTAFVYITGSFPTHLRRNYTAVLRAVTQYFRTPTALDHRAGSIGVTDKVVSDLKLDEHPMVIGVKRFLAEGYVIQPSRHTVSRRPYSKVFLYRTEDVGDRVTVQVDGSVKQGWD